MRRQIRSELWSFLRPGEGEVAEFVATAKYNEAKRALDARIARSKRAEQVCYSV